MLREFQLPKWPKIVLLSNRSSFFITSLGYTFSNIIQYIDECMVNTMVNETSSMTIIVQISMLE